MSDDTPITDDAPMPRKNQNPYTPRVQTKLCSFCGKRVAVVNKEKMCEECNYSRGEVWTLDMNAKVWEWKRKQHTRKAEFIHRTNPEPD